MSVEEDYSFKQSLIFYTVLGLIVGGACQWIFGKGFFTVLLLMLGGEDERTTNRAETSDSSSERGASVLNFQTSNSRAEEASSVPCTEDSRRKRGRKRDELGQDANGEHEEEELTENQAQLRQQIRRLVTLTAWLREEFQLMTADSVGFTEGEKRALKYQLHNAEKTVNQLRASANRLATFHT
jgi:hypothetical protein